MQAERPSLFAQIGMAMVEALRANMPKTQEALFNARVAYLQMRYDLCLERLTWALFQAKLEKGK